MSWIETPENQRYAWYLRPILALLRRRPRGLSEPVRLWARLPLAFLGFQLMNFALERRASPLQAGLRALIRARVAQMNHCPFCVDLNASRALARGVAPERLRDLARFRDSPRFGEDEKDALAYAEAITRAGDGMDPALIGRLRSAFGDDGVIELAALVAHQNLSAKFNAALGVPAEGLCRTGHGIAPPE